MHALGNRAVYNDCVVTGRITIRPILRNIALIPSRLPDALSRSL